MYLDPLGRDGKRKHTLDNDGLICEGVYLIISPGCTDYSRLALSRNEK